MKDRKQRSDAVGFCEHGPGQTHAIVMVLYIYLGG